MEEKSGGERAEALKDLHPKWLQTHFMISYGGSENRKLKTV